MDRNLIDPPAIVKADQAIGHLIEEAKTIHGAIVQADKANLTRAIDLGNLLERIKEKTPHGEWEKTMKLIGISRSRAAEYRQLAKCPARDISIKIENCESIREAMKLLGPTSSEENNDVTEENVTSEVLSAPTILCRSCRLNGQKKGCKDCKAIREREPGDDTEIEEEQNGKPDDVDHHGRKKNKPHVHKPHPPRDELKDKVGNVLPDSCRDVFADHSLDELIEEVELTENALEVESLVKRAGALTPHFGFILFDKFTEHSYEALHQIQVALENLRAGVPYALCPKCKGENGEHCKTCRGYKYIPEHKWKDLAK